MKKLLGILAVSAIGVAAWFADVEKQDIPHVNVLGGVNPGFENSTSKWSKTGSSTLAATTANVAYGVSAGEWDASATGEFLRSADVAVPKGLEGRACLMEFEYWLVGGSAGDIVVRVETDGGDALTSDLTLAVNGKYAKAQLGFICPTADSIRIEFESTANASVLRVDQAYLGRDHRLGDTTPITAWEDFPLTFSGGFSSTTIRKVTARRVGHTLHVKGLVELVSSAASAAVIDLPSGYTIDSSSYATTSNAQQVGTMQRMRSTGAATNNYLIRSILFYDGSDTDSIYVSLLQATSGAEQYDKSLSSNMFASGDSLDFEFAIPIAEWAGSGTNNVTLETQGWYVDAKISGPNVNIGAPENNTYAPLEISTLTLAKNSGSAEAYIPCAGTEVASGNTCTGNEVAGVAFEAPYAGKFMACFYMTIGHRPAVGLTTSLSRAGLRLDYAQNASQASITEGFHPTLSGDRADGDSDSNGAFVPHNGCEIFDFSSAGLKTLRLNYNSEFDGAGSFYSLILDEGSTNGEAHLNIRVTPITQNMPQAVALTGDRIGVTDNSVAAAGYVGEYIEDTNGVTALTSGIYFDVAGGIVLTPGTWDLQANMSIETNTNDLKALRVFIGTATGNSVSGIDIARNTTDFGPNGSAAAGPMFNSTSYNTSLATPVFRVNISSNTTYYGKGQATFGSGVVTMGNGFLRATRVR